MTNKNTRQVAANIKNDARKLKRKESKELKKLNKHFSDYCDNFYKILFADDFDKGGIIEINGQQMKLDDLDLFNDYNAGWISFCEYWNTDKHHLIPANSEAFHELIIDNTKNNNDDKPFSFTSFQLTYLCWTLPCIQL